MCKKNKIGRLLTDNKAVAPVVGTLLMLMMVIPLASGTMMYFTQMNDSMRDTFQTQNEVNVAMLDSQREFMDALSNVQWNFTGNTTRNTDGYIPWDPTGPDPDPPDDDDDPPLLIFQEEEGGWLFLVWCDDDWFEVDQVLSENGTIIWPP